MAQVSFISAQKLVELVNGANPKRDMLVRVLGPDQLALGVDPFNPTNIIDLSNEAIRAATSSLTNDSGPAPKIATKPRLSRKSGRYLLDIKGKIVECKSLKEMLGEGLCAFERHQSGTLAQLAQIKGRTKRIVSRDPNDLFEDDELVQNFAEKLGEGWWFGTNNSSQETLKWLRQGAEYAGLEWGKDVSTSL